MPEPAQSRFRLRPRVVRKKGEKAKPVNVEKVPGLGEVRSNEEVPAFSRNPDGTPNFGVPPGKEIVAVVDRDGSVVRYEFRKKSRIPARRGRQERRGFTSEAARREAEREALEISARRTR